MVPGGGFGDYPHDRELVGSSLSGRESAAETAPDSTAWDQPPERSEVDECVDSCSPDLATA